MGSAPAVAAHLSRSEESKVTAHLDHLRGQVASGLGSAAFTSRVNCLKTQWEAGACEPPKMQVPRLLEAPSPLVLVVIFIPPW